jgi:molybdenum cofactor cytidylyltransferase
MRQAPGFCGVILAAGESTRMGRDKALLPWPPGGNLSAQTFLSGTICALSPFSDMVIVVVGANELNLAPIAYANGASVVRNPAPEDGQFSSLKVGLQQVLNYGRDAAIVTLVDRPPANVATLQTLISAFVATPNEVWAVVPEHNGKHGHPILLAREMIEVFLKAPANATARDIEHQNQQHVQYIPVGDTTVTLNVNTPEEYASLASTPPLSK